jgi:hypothetical protein
MARRSSTPQGRSRPAQASSRAPNGQILPPRLDPLRFRAGPNSPAGAPAYLSTPTITGDDRGRNGARGAGDISLVNYPLCDLWMSVAGVRITLLRAFAHIDGQRGLGITSNPHLLARELAQTSQHPRAGHIEQLFSHYIFRLASIQQDESAKSIASALSSRESNRGESTCSNPSRRR